MTFLKNLQRQWKKLKWNLQKGVEKEQKRGFLETVGRPQKGLKNHKFLKTKKRLVCKVLFQSEKDY